MSDGDIPSVNITGPVVFSDPMLDHHAALVGMIARLTAAVDALEARTAGTAKAHSGFAGRSRPSTISAGAPSASK